jgi:hypothetical protein
MYGSGRCVQRFLVLASRSCCAVATTCVALLFCTSARAQGVPDLRIEPNAATTFVASPPNTAPGGRVTLSSVLIENGGTADSPAFSAGVYISTDGALTSGDRRLGARSLSGLAAGEGTSWAPAVTVPPDLAPGDYTIGIVADDAGAVVESNEANNALGAAEVLRVVGPLDADLVPSTQWGSEPSISAGTAWQPVTAPGSVVSVAPAGKLYLFRWSAHNAGAEATPGFSVGFYLSPDAVITRSDRRLGRASVGGLAAGATYESEVLAEYTVPGDLAPGDYYFGLLVDDLDQVIETAGGQEGNNVMTRRVRILNVPSDALPVWRAQLRLRTGDVDDAKTDDAVYARLNAHRTYMNYGRNDFERGDAFTYDLVLNGVTKLGDITELTVGKEGSNGWCVSGLSLIVNNVTVYSQDFGPPCKWLDPPGGQSTWAVAYSDLRQHASWQAYSPLTAALGILDGLKHGDLESIIEANVGHGLYGTDLYWGKLHGRAVEVTRRSDTSLDVDLDLAADLPYSGDAEIDVDFHLDIGCSCGVVSVVASPATVEADVPWYLDLLAWVGEAVAGIDAGLERTIELAVGATLDTGQPTCPLMSVASNGDVNIGIPSSRPDVALGMTVNPTQVQPGARVLVETAATNIGNVASGAITSELFLALGTAPLTTTLDALASTGTSLSTHQHAAAPACGAPASWSHEVQLPPDLKCAYRLPGLPEKPQPPRFARVAAQRSGGLPQPTPRYYLVERATSAADVNPANDLAARMLEVGLPDLVASPVIVRPNSVRAGGTVTLERGYVANAGLFASGNVSYRFFLSRSGAGPVHWWDGGTHGPLEPATAARWNSRQLTIPSGISPGQYTFGVAVKRDAGGECDVANNTRTVSMTVGP